MVLLADDLSTQVPCHAQLKDQYVGELPDS